MWDIRDCATRSVLRIAAQRQRELLAIIAHDAEPEWLDEKDVATAGLELP
jgi:hypothetical protein